MFFQFIGLLGCLPHFGVRMQEISFLFFTLLLIILNELNKNKKIYWYFLPILFLIWANLHGGFLIGLASLGFWIFIKGLELIRNKKIENKKIFFKGLIFLLLSTAITLINPYGFKLYVFLKDYFTNTAYFSLIKEWQPLYFSFSIQKVIFIGTVLSILIIKFITEKKTIIDFVKKNLWEVLIFTIFLILTFKSIRHFPLFLIVSFFTVIPFLKDYKKEVIIKNKLIYNLSEYFIVLCFLIMPLNYLSKVSIKYNNHPFNFTYYCQSHPCQAVEFLKKNPQYKKLKLLNNYDFGGYLIWTLPDWRLFIDGRLPQYPFNGQSLIEEVTEFDKEKNIEKKLKEHKIEIVLWKKSKVSKNKLNFIDKYILFTRDNLKKGGKHTLLKYLDENKNWKKVFEDKISVIYVKK
jgi:hypothetical protein